MCFRAQLGLGSSLAQERPHAAGAAREREKGRERKRTNERKKKREEEFSGRLNRHPPALLWIPRGQRAPPWGCHGKNQAGPRWEPPSALPRPRPCRPGGDPRPSPGTPQGPTRGAQKALLLLTCPASKPGPSVWPEKEQRTRARSRFSALGVKAPADGEKSRGEETP